MRLRAFTVQRRCIVQNLRYKKFFIYVIFMENILAGRYKGLIRLGMLKNSF